MKVVYIASDRGIYYHQNGGAGTHIRGTIGALRNNGVEVVPVLAGDFNGIAESLSNKKQTIFAATSVQNLSSNTGLYSRIKSLMPKRMLLFLRDKKWKREYTAFEMKAAEIIKKEKPDILYERSAYRSLVGINLAKRFNLPLYVESDGCMVEVINDNYGVFSIRKANKQEACKLNNCTAVVTYNQASIDLIKEKFRISHNRFVIKTTGVNPVNTQLLSKEAYKKELDLQLPFIVGFVGMISKYHGIPLLLEAARKLRSYGNIHFVIVGAGKDIENYKKIVKSENLNIKFVGKVNSDQVFKYFSVFDIGIIPDSVENIYPVKLLEYGLYKVCPLVPDYKMFKQMLGEDAAFFKRKDAASLANVILSLSENESEISKIKEQWFDEVENGYLWDKTVLTLIESFKGNL